MSRKKTLTAEKLLFWIIFLPIMLFIWGWKRSKKVTLLVTAITLIIVLILSIYNLESINEFYMSFTEEKKPSSTQLPTDSELSVHFISVGQADSIFIDYGDYDILIDGGNNDDGQLVVEYLKELATDDIEIIVATHPHEDHIGGLDDVIKAYSVETIIDSGLNYTTKTYRDYYSAAQNEEGVAFLHDESMTFDLSDDIIFEVIETGDDFKDTNDYSVVTMLDFGDVEFLFTGDMEAHTELETLDLYSDIDVLKVGHHGSRTSSSEEFLSIVKPEYAVISVGQDNRYGHPHEETLEKLTDRNVKFFRTDEQGHIIVTTDGNNVFFNCEPIEIDQ